MYLGTVWIFLDHLNDMVTVLAFNQIRHLSGLQGKSGIFKFFDHLTAAKSSQISSVGGTARILRILFGQFAKVTAGLNFTQNFLGFGLSLGINGWVVRNLV